MGRQTVERGRPSNAGCLPRQFSRLEEEMLDQDPAVLTDSILFLSLLLLRCKSVA